MKNTYLGQAWLVLALGVTLGGALAGVHVGLKDRIEANKKAETYRNIPALVPGAVEDKTVEKTIAGQTVYQARSADGRVVGWVVPAKGQGFADVVEVLIGLDAGAQRITGLAVLDQKETPGLGNKIEDDSFRGQLAGKSAREALRVTKAAPAGNEIQAITGATISSESVAGIVNATVKDLRDELAKAAKE